MSGMTVSTKSAIYLGEITSTTNSKSTTVKIQKKNTNIQIDKITDIFTAKT